MLRVEFGFDSLRLVALTAWGRDIDRNPASWRRFSTGVREASRRNSFQHVVLSRRHTAT
jgi:hypothetical protein